MGFFRWFFLGGFYGVFGWVFYCQPCLLVQVLGDRHPLLRLLRHDGELEPLVVAQQGQHAGGHLAEK